MGNNFIGTTLYDESEMQVSKKNKNIYIWR